MNYDLLTSVEISGRTYAIRSDYRAILDIISVVNDNEIDEEERTLLALQIFYEGFEDMPLTDFEEAISKLYGFVAGGEERNDGTTQKPKLMDWDQDFPIIVAPVNRILGYEVRDVEYMHWWTFLAAYYEIGDCLFSQIVAIRKKRRMGKKLDKSDQEFYTANQDIIDFKTKTTSREENILSEWI